ncbi:cytochrome P450 [Flexivirga caeni]|nr:cytochrome P450 [Flexivirga caeni]
MPTPQFPPDISAAATDFVRRFTTSLSFAAPTDHARLRRVMLQHFSSRAVEAFRRDVDAIAGDALRHVPQGVTVDLVAAVADPLPLRTTAALAGIPVQHWAGIEKIARAMLGTVYSFQYAEPVTRIIPADFRWFERTLTQLVSDPNMSTGGVSAGIARSVRDQMLTPDEAVSLLMLLFMTGVDTVAAALANVALALTERPALGELAAADVHSAGEVVDEVLRLNPPLPYAVREVVEDFHFGTHQLRTGDRVFLCLAAANLDPRRYPDPLQWRLGRPPSSSFGHGAHRCLGGSLARLQVVSVVHRLARTGLSAAGENVVWKDIPSINTPKHLLVRIGRGGEVAA